MAREMRPVIGEFCKKLDQRLKDDIDKNEIPNILHEVGNFITVLNRQRMSNLARDLNRSFQNACQAAFRVSEEEPKIADKFEELSFQKTTMILNGLSHSARAEVDLLRQINKQLNDPNEPKSVAAIIRLVDKITSEDQTNTKSNFTLSTVSKVLCDPEQFDLVNAPIEVQTRLLRRFASQGFHQNNPNNQVCLKLVQNIQKDLNRVEER